MAPTFLQKLAKATNPNGNQPRDRLPSDSNVSGTKPSSGRLSISRNRSPSVSIKSGSGSNASTTNIPNEKQNITNDIPSINISTSPVDGRDVEHKASFDSLDTVSTQPNVTIIPPSPLLGTKDIDSDCEDQGLPQPPSAGSSPKHIKSSPEKQDKSVVPQDTQSPVSSPISPAPTITPTNITDKMSSSNGGLAPSSLLRNKASNKSLNSGKKTPPSDIQIKPPPLPHHRAATAPAETMFPSPDYQPETNATSINTVSESPTELFHPVNKSDSQPTADAMSTAAEVSPKGLGKLQPEQTGSKLSLISAVTGSPETPKSSKRPWKRSTTRKPTGLAALAASGLAMANPHSAQAAAQVSPPISASSSTGQKSAKSNGAYAGSGPGSPPYLSTTPAQSAVSQKSWQEKGKKDLSPKAAKSGRNDPPRQSRPRRTSRATSAKSDAGASEYSTMGPSTFGNGTVSAGTSVNGDDSFTRPDYYSALELDADTSSEDMSGSDMSGGEDDYGDDLIPVTGFAVASTKRNQDFHEVFPTVPEGDYLIEDYGCALQREILIQGRLYISENHICFHANIFGWITDLSIPVYEITALEKRMTAFVIPNAIQITTRQAKYTFTSFLSRDTTYDVMHNIWRLSRPGDSISMISGSGGGSIDGPLEVLSNDTAVVTPAGGAPVKVTKKATTCACGREGKHYSETAMDVIIPGTPEKINTMLFASGFIKEFMSENQKLLDIQMSDWAPVSPGSKMLTQNLTYIKPLAGSLGPKQTKCEIKHEMVHCDFDEYISTVTTTRTPDVPSGGVFAVRTRTCVMWASPVSSKVIITSQIEWSGRSFIKGIIEKSAIDGQKSYHADLEKAMRTYIQEHQSEFLPEGVEAAAIPVLDELPTPTPAGVLSEDHLPTPEELKQRERERNARGLQWAWDTFDGAYQVAKRSTKGALELIKDAWDQSTSTTILWFLIVILVLSNLWTLIRMGSNKAEAARKLEVRKVEEREKWVQSIVTALWEELSATNGGTPVILQPSQVAATTTTPPQVTPSSTTILESVGGPPSQHPMMQSMESWKEEIRQLRRTMQELEGRVLVVKDSLAAYEIRLNALD